MGSSTGCQSRVRRMFVVRNRAPESEADAQHSQVADTSLRHLGSDASGVSIVFGFTIASSAAHLIKGSCKHRSEHSSRQRSVKA
jgi:hypothetical protein